MLSREGRFGADYVAAHLAREAQIHLIGDGDRSWDTEGRLDH